MDAAHTVEAPRLAALRAALAAAPDPTSALARASGRGRLDDVDFFELGRFLDAYEEVVALLADSAALFIGGLGGGELEGAAAALHVELARGRTAERTFYLNDTFDAPLAAARAASNASQAAFDSARSRLAERAAAYAGVERLREGEFVVMRERLRAPVPPEIRIVRDAPTYVLCELALDDPASKR